MTADLATMLRWFHSRGLICSTIPSLGDTLVFEPTVRLFGQPRLFECRIGAYSYISPGTTLNRTTIGRYCSIGSHCEIGPTQHPNDWLTTSPIAYKDVFATGKEFTPGEQHQELAPVRIGNDVWIGSGAAIMGGVTIGDGAIVGYGSVVTRNVAPYTIVGGTPARMIRSRFDQATVNSLLASLWWRYDLVHMRGTVLAWRKPLQALAEIQKRAIAGEIGLIPPLWHTIRRHSGNQFALERHVDPPDSIAQLS
jgi:acetyltransferase-like isoleucine patch superfamily enzyme